MRKGAAIFFLSIYLLGNTPLGEFCKLPKLYEHFQEHKSSDASLTFVVFLEMHYFNGDPQDADYAEDMKLPFKTIDSQMVDFAQLSVDLPQWVTTRCYFNQHYTKMLPSRNPHLFTSYLDSIWQPPQIA